jgi:hypothetical protein
VAGDVGNQGGEAFCGVPFPEAKGVFINIVAVEPTAAGYLTAYPFPSLLPPLASTLNFSPGQNIANGVLIAICDNNVDNCAFDLTVTMGPAAAADIVIDVTGYLQAPDAAAASRSRPPGR